MWDINKGEIVIAVGNRVHIKDKTVDAHIYVLSAITITMKTNRGLQTKTLDYAKAGTAFSLEYENKKVNCSVGTIGHSDISVAVVEETY